MVLKPNIRWCSTTRTRHPASGAQPQYRWCSEDLILTQWWPLPTSTPAHPWGIDCCITLLPSDREHVHRPEGLLAGRSVNSDRNAHLNQQSRRPGRSSGQSTGATETAIKAQPHPTLPGHSRAYGSRLRGRGRGIGRTRLRHCRGTDYDRARPPQTEINAGRRPVYAFVP